MSVFKIKEINSDTGKEQYLELTGAVLQRYELSAENSCIQFNGQAGSHVIIVAREPGPLAFTMVELVDTYTPGKGDADDACDHLAADACNPGSPLMVLNPALADGGFADFVEFMYNRNDSPIEEGDIVGVAVAKAGGTLQKVVVSQGENTGRTLFSFRQIYSEQPVEVLDLAGTSEANYWAAENTAITDPFRKIRNANVRINLRNTDGAARKAVVLVFSED